MPLKDKKARSEYHKRYMRKWYALNRAKHIKLVHVSRKKKIEKFVELKRKSICADCGVSGKKHPEIMDFDHLRDKSFNVGSGVTRFSKAKMLEEMQKCEIVCANCHRIRTAKRRKTKAV